MTKTEKLHRAKMYIDKLFEGINPIDNTYVDKDDVINSERNSSIRRRSER